MPRVGGHKVSEKSARAMARVKKHAKMMQLTEKQEEKVEYFQEELCRMGDIFDKGKRSIGEIVKEASAYAVTQGKSGVKVLLLVRSFDLVKTLDDETSFKLIDAVFDTFNVAQQASWIDVATELKGMGAKLKDFPMLKEHKKTWDEAINNVTYLLKK